MRIRPEDPARVQIEFAASYRRPIPCSNAKSGDTAHECVRCEDKPFNKHAIMPIRHRTAAWVVEIDGKPYAGFVDRAHADEAAKRWKGYVDGNGIPVEEVGEAHWPAVEGRVVRVIRKGHMFK